MSPVSAVLHFALFLSVFMIDVRVKAEGLQLPNAHEVQQEPEGCLEGQSPSAGPCAFRTRNGERFATKISGATITLDQATALIRVSENELRLVTGTVWVKADAAFTVRSEFGGASTSGAGEIWVVHGDDRMSVSSIAGTTVLLPRGGEALRLDEGMVNWIGKVGADGISVTGLPVAVPYLEHLKRWARLYPGTYEKFEKDALKFRSAWSKASEAAVELHKEVYERKLASMAETAAKQAEQKRKVEARDRELRNMFRKKLFEE